MTEIANKFGDTKIIDNWLRAKSTIEFLGFWESLHNSKDFNSLEFEGIKNEAGSNRFIMSVKKWVSKTNAIGINAKTGKYHSGTYAHKDIAMAFCAWISPEFQLFIIKEFQRLKKDEAEKNNELKDWNEHRWLTRINYKVHTDAVKEGIIVPSNITSPLEQNKVYGEEGNLYNLAVFGMKAGDFEKYNPDLVKNGKNLRDTVNKKVLSIIIGLQSSNARMVLEGLSLRHRLKELIKQANREKKSLGINTIEDLFRSDLFSYIQLPGLIREKYNRLSQQEAIIQAPTEFVSAIDKIIKKP